MTIKYHKDFTKAYKKLPSNVKDKLKARLILFEQDEFNSLLNNHSLKGKYLGIRSINITGDLRALYQKGGHIVIFVSIDSHSNLYG